ncbi:uncharacterized protein L969DRAFT_91619 [Mixia osmundae IAM 14324]|uniref:3-isopropylmalate dehydrogenase n=1 Tax=Mixia osmundae (strain CBS 9802 / IAM 14324 / JCM 22182 / KY 12970) TaxID=764103 RepID=G7E003_MIXOS|nr:uncharacterized protein L969DRAFT_91619 [Mixia osmundae IAM 14324]KEI42154.1 hypothetical protein L969DRAFT_91619 [Mixia osmundae IAM 14324]GAA96163.1 hypothetical protein E5Q_02824 [Mixia osmundae IAM 14324]
MSYKIVVLPGDGIGPEVTGEAVRVLKHLATLRPSLSFDIESHDFGGAAIDSTGEPLPPKTLDACRSAHAILLGAVGGPKWGTGKIRPEQGILGLRKALDLYANIRPALFPSESLLKLSPLKEEHAKGTSIICLRELVGGIYFGDRQEAEQGDPKGAAWDRCDYSVPEVERIARVAAHLALAADPPLEIHSIDKANVLATSRLWRSTVTALFAKEFPQLKIDHHLVDSAAMVIGSRPRKLNGIILTDNLFGDILSDQLSVIPGSLGLLPSASLAGLPDGKGKCLGIYEPIHGSAPDIAGKGIANPIGTILSVGMLLRYSLSLGEEADLIENAVRIALDESTHGGHQIRTADLGGSAKSVDVGAAVITALDSLCK